MTEAPLPDSERGTPHAPVSAKSLHPQHMAVVVGLWVLVLGRQSVVAVLMAGTAADMVVAVKVGVERKDDLQTATTIEVLGSWPGTL